MEIENKEISEYVKAILDGIDKGISKDYHISPKTPIEFELAVINKNEASGGLRILVANAKGKVSGEHVSKVKFKVSRRPPAPFVA